VASSNVTSGSLPLTVNFSSAGSFDPDSATLTYAWDFNGDQIIDSTAPNPTHTFTTAGTYLVQLTVTDTDLLFSRANLTISAGNNAPVITFNTPANFSFFDWGDQLNFSLSVTDAEDGSTASGSIPASSVLFEGSLGHDDHQHNEIQFYGLSGPVTIPRDASHGFDQDLGYAFDGFYTDLGAPGVLPIERSATVFLQPKITQAQTRDGQSGTTTAPTSDPVGGVLDVNSIDHGDHISFTGLNLAGIQSIHFRVLASGAGGNIEIRQGSLTGNLIGTANVTDTGSAYRDISVSNLQNVLPGSHNLYFIFTRTPGATELFRLNWINFRGIGATAIPDRPRLSSTTITAPNTLRLIFNQAMDLSSLGNPANYAIDKGAIITAVTPIANQSGVVLSFSGLVQGGYHSLNLTGLMDLAGDSIAPSSQATFINLQAVPPQFVIGLNAGGPNFTDSAGNLYIADTTPAILPAPVTILADFTTTSGSGLPTNASHFLAGDSKVNSSAVVNFINTANPISVPLVGTNIAGVTFSHTGGNGIFSTGNGGFVDDVPILDGYIFESSVNGSTATINGLGDIPAGTPMTLTLWGTGDTPNSDAQYTVQYNSSTVGTATTDYDAIGAPRPANTVPARVSFTFNKVAGINSITIVWGKGSTGTAGFGGFSLTALQGIPSAPVTYYSGGSTYSTTSSIANTQDDALYQTERFSGSNFTYSIPLPNGRYKVLLRFAEIYANTAGSRAFNTRIEGGANLFSPDLDLVARTGGKNRAFDHVVDNITVNDGILNIDMLKGSVDSPKISAIGVFQYSQIASIPYPSFATFLNEQPGANLNAESDVDQDGLSALLEYALGGSEETQDAARLPQLLRLPGGDFDYVFNRPAGLPDLIYNLQASNNLGVWVPITPVRVVNSLGGNVEEVRFQGLIPAAQAAAIAIEPSTFFRLVVSLTPVTP
jgi:PKD repeat protein